ncbi:DEAD/DEAH box helicase family protein [Flagellimonas onchidii]|uniref:DEAD/DEAH box helicase family protein n=1 Tax=Flagellimonas onchidii TaxID=2562684 RepID=UPI0010A66EDF|nr:DEAD/DEAH box helicase family protein [Allomuricauda onchidii]
MKQTLVTPFNFLIQYKELNHSDFLDYNFEDTDKTVIEPNEQGYISERLRETIDLTKKDTTVINAAVGQGKTTAIIELIASYYQQSQISADNYKIIVVTPFKALNDSYQLKIDSRINEDVCFNYLELEKQYVTSDHFHAFYSKSVQLISIKSILGDSGKYPAQSKKKRDYYEYLIRQCGINGEKVILIFDEIHESLDTFKPKFLPNLFKWKLVTHKVIVASATFSEASKVAVKFFAELTEKNIKIIESQRPQNVQNLSELHLCIYDQYKFKEDDQYIIDVVESLIEGCSTANILCYSRNVAKEINSSRLGRLLRQHFDSTNLCIGDEDSIFDSDSCNIGTKFKTGISIEKEDSLYIVILPLKFAYSEGRNDAFGIFTDRINSLIQALARPRKKSRICVIMPSPLGIIMTPNASGEYFKRLSHGRTELSEIPFRYLKQQDSILLSIYESKRRNIEIEIEQTENLPNDIKAQFPTYDWFKISEGDQLLYSQYQAYGKNLSNYMYWAAWNNQFTNCKLQSIIEPTVFLFEEGFIQKRLSQYFESNEIFSETESDLHIYRKIRGKIFSNVPLYKSFKSKEYSLLESYRNSNFEKQLITFVQRIRKTDSEIQNAIYPPDGEIFFILDGMKIYKDPQDSVPEKEAYFKMCIAHSLEMEKYRTGFSKDESMVVNAYLSIYKYRDILLNEYSFEDQKGNRFLPLAKNLKINEGHLLELTASFSLLMDLDVTLKCFSMRGLDKNYRTIYSFLRDLFFDFTRTSDTIKGQGKCYRINGLNQMPDIQDRINLIYNNVSQNNSFSSVLVQENETIDINELL